MTEVAERPDYEVAADELRALIERERLTIAATFVPYSQTEHAKGPKPWPSLNWRVTVKRDGRDVLESTYSAGSGHAPASKMTNPRKALAVAWELENGRPAGGVRFDHSAGPDGRGAWVAFAKIGGKPLLPDAVDVLGSLFTDSDVLDAGGFEEWAANLGYDTDSRKAEAIYRACIDNALKLRAALGDAVLTEARELAQRL